MLKTTEIPCFNGIIWFPFLRMNKNRLVLASAYNNLALVLFFFIKMILYFRFVIPVSLWNRACRKSNVNSDCFMRFWLYIWTPNQIKLHQMNKQRWTYEEISEWSDAPEWEYINEKQTWMFMSIWPMELYQMKTDNDKNISFGIFGNKKTKRTKPDYYYYVLLGHCRAGFQLTRYGIWAIAYLSLI